VGRCGAFILDNVGEDDHSWLQVSSGQVVVRVLRSTHSRVSIIQAMVSTQPLSILAQFSDEFDPFHLLRTSRLQFLIPRG